ncbi:MAG: PQQ-binding-like beta-propeller repeat protein [Limisphaerales bacterium]
MRPEQLLDGKIYALNPDGTPSKSTLWPYYAGGEVFSSPVIGANNMLYVGSASGKLYAFWNDVGPGSTAWPVFRCGTKRTGNPANTW